MDYAECHVAKKRQSTRLPPPDEPAGVWLTLPHHRPRLMYFLPISILYLYAYTTVRPYCTIIDSPPCTVARFAAPLFSVRIFGFETESQYHFLIQFDTIYMLWRASRRGILLQSGARKPRQKESSDGYETGQQSSSRTQTFW